MNSEQQVDPDFLWMLTRINSVVKKSKRELIMIILETEDPETCLNKLKDALFESQRKVETKLASDKISVSSIFANIEGLTAEQLECIPVMTEKVFVPAKTYRELMSEISEVMYQTNITSEIKINTISDLLKISDFLI